MPLTVQALDHLVVQVSDVEASAKWYGRVLGMTREDVPQRPASRRGPRCRFGRQKINLRPIATSKEDWFTADHEAAGSEDLCFLTDATPDEVVRAFAGARGRHRGRPRAKTGRAGHADIRLLPRSGRQPDRDRVVRRRLAIAFKALEICSAGGFPHADRTEDQGGQRRETERSALGSLPRGQPPIGGSGDSRLLG